MSALKKENSHVIAISGEENPANHDSPILYDMGTYWLGSFQAMASPCEVLISGTSLATASHLTKMAAEETWRIENKFSRYVQGNTVDQINSSDGNATEVDAETARLVDYAHKCFEISAGKFDISSGVLRKAWHFDGSDQIPDDNDIKSLLTKVGLHKIKWKDPQLTLEEGMELDFGGIGKEYAVDRTLLLLINHIKQNTDEKGAILVNFGGDIHCSGPQADGTPWKIGVEKSSMNSDQERLFKQASTPNSITEIPNNTELVLELSQGALATSGDSQRFLLKEGVRYSHILDPNTGWPVPDAPHSVTVAATTCTQAGVLATFALLEGKNAEAYLKEQKVRFWVQR